MQNSPYVGTLRHAPPSSMLQSELYRILLEKSLLPRKINGLYDLTSLLNGRLMGGNPAEDFELSFLTGRSTSRRSLSTVDVLGRLACWLLMPFADPTPSVKVPLESDETSSVESPSSYDDDDDDDCSSLSDSLVFDTALPQNDFGNSVLSSDAEAYYAHEATKNLLLEPQRLDYTITQMDVMRMMRHASRHLDVESIVQLPVYTFHKPVEQPPAEAEMSWLLVDKLEDKPPPPPREDEHDVCVICLEHFDDGDRVRVLPCQHQFHVGCIDRWLSGSHSFSDCVTSGCPTCKKRPVLEESISASVPSWAFCRIGDALARSSATST